MFQKQRQSKSFQTFKDKIIHHQQTHITRNIKEVFWSGKEMIPDRNLHLQKRMRTLESGCDASQHRIILKFII